MRWVLMVFLGWVLAGDHPRLEGAHSTHRYRTRLATSLTVDAAGQPVLVLGIARQRRRRSRLTLA